MSTAYSQAIATKQAIIDALVAELGSSGALHLATSVGPVFYPEGGSAQYPYVGVELVDLQESALASNTRVAHCIWGISISVEGAKGGLLQDIYPTRDALVDDGNGKGVCYILRRIAQDQSYSRHYLGGLIYKAEITRITPSTNFTADKQDAPTQAYAEAAIIYETWQAISF